MTTYTLAGQRYDASQYPISPPAGPGWPSLRAARAAAREYLRCARLHTIHGFGERGYDDGSPSPDPDEMRVCPMHAADDDIESVITITRQADD